MVVLHLPLSCVINDYSLQIDGSFTAEMSLTLVASVTLQLDNCRILVHCCRPCTVYYKMLSAERGGVETAPGR